MSSSVSRLRGGSLRPPWHAGKPRPGVLLPDKEIIGSGVDGSIFHLTLLNIDALRLLRFIQEMYKSQIEVSSSTSEINTRLRMDVDGDQLLSVVMLGKDKLKEAVEKEELKMQSSSISGGDGRGGMRFVEMVEKLLGPLEGRDVVAVALEYLKDLLQGVVL